MSLEHPIIKKTEQMIDRVLIKHELGVPSIEKSKLPTDRRLVVKFAFEKTPADRRTLNKIMLGFLNLKDSEFKIHPGSIFPIGDGSMNALAASGLRLHPDSGVPMISIGSLKPDSQSTCLVYIANRDHYLSGKRIKRGHYFLELHYSGLTYEQQNHLNKLFENFRKIG